MALPEAIAGSDALAAVAGRSGWLISDGRAGNDVQSRGVFDALGLAYQVKPVSPRGLWKLLAPWGPVDPAERFGTPASQFHPPWPDFAIAIGRATIPYVRKLKALAGLGTYTIILLDPRVSAKAADLIWVPEHDTRRGPNVITTLTAPHSFSEHRLAELRATLPPRSKPFRARASRCPWAAPTATTGTRPRRWRILRPRCNRWRPWAPA